MNDIQNILQTLPSWRNVCPSLTTRNYSPVLPVYELFSIMVCLHLVDYYSYLTINRKETMEHMEKMDEFSPPHICYLVDKLTPDILV